MATSTIKRQPFIQAGSVSMGTVQAGTIATVDVTFPVAFPSVPTVVVGFKTNSDQGDFGNCSCGVMLTDLTATTCKIRVYNGGTSQRSPNCNWIAVG